MSTHTMLVCRTVLDGAFDKFRDSTKRIEKLVSPASVFQTKARIAPTQYGFWLVRMTSTKDPSDPGNLKLISPEESARVPWDQPDPNRELHLFARANVFSGKNPGENSSEVVCTVYRTLNFSRECDRQIIDIQHFIAKRFELEESFLRLPERNRGNRDLFAPLVLSEGGRCLDPVSEDRQLVSV